MMIEKIMLDMLTQDSVSIRKQNVTVIDGKEYPIGQPWRRAYVNSIQGRAAVTADVSDPYKTAILSVWGNAPTVTEEVTE